jgi:DNA-directed RNA polymerase beta subunit
MNTAQVVLSDEDRWAVADKYFGPNPGRTLVKHQLESFNDFVLRKLEAVIASFNPIEFHLGAAEVGGGVRSLHPGSLAGRPPPQHHLKLTISDPVLCRPRIFGSGRHA